MKGLLGEWGGGRALRLLGSRVLRALLDLASVVGWTPRSIRLLRIRWCRGLGVEVGAGPTPTLPPGDHHLLLDLDLAGTPNGYLCIRGDASALPLPSDRFDFLLSAHCLEHCPDTLRTLTEWRRVLRPGGILFLILPHGGRGFDRGRTLSTLAHHLEDQERTVGLLDPGPWAEWGAALNRTPPGWWSSGEFHLPSGEPDWPKIATSGRIHYHAWTEREMGEVLRHLEFDILDTVPTPRDRLDSFLLIARRAGALRDGDRGRSGDRGQGPGANQD